MKKYLRRVFILFVDRNPSLILSVFVLAIALILAGARPVRGRWDVPETAESIVRSRSSSGKAVVATATAVPTPTPLILPDQAHVPIIMYHYVSELPSNADRYRRDLTVSPERFAEQLEYLSQAGYHAITLGDLHLHLNQGYPLPKKPIVLTFDDGYRDAYDVVFPLLSEYGFTGTFFVLATPAHFESPGYLTWQQMKEMTDAGMEIQAHGRDHVDLRGRSYDYLIYQLVGIQEAIKYHTGYLPRFFCYPGGRYDARVIEVLKSVGYWGAVTTDWGSTHTRESAFEMPRVRLRGADTLESFIKKLEQ